MRLKKKGRDKYINSFYKYFPFFVQENLYKVLINRKKTNFFIKLICFKVLFFPTNPIFTIQGRDTVAMPSGDSPYKILTYIDTLGCNSCKLQLPKWQELMVEVDSVVSMDVPFLFYFHPKNMKEMRYVTMRDGFIYPVCFDENDELNRLNKFPERNDVSDFPTGCRQPRGTGR